MPVSRKSRFIIAIDPSNECAGLSLWLHGRCLYSTGFSPWCELTLCEAQGWTLGLEPGVAQTIVDSPVELFYEEPQHGAHSSRAGVMRACGMVIQAIRHKGYEVRRAGLHAVKPRVWRARTHGRTQGTFRQLKRAAVVWARSYAPLAPGLTGMARRRLRDEDHDEAEAICLGAYGCMQLGVELR